MQGRAADADALAKDLARKSMESRVLQRVSSEINSTLDLEEIYRISLATMDELFDFHHSLILLLDADGSTLTVVASRGYEGQATGGRARVGAGVIGMVAKKRRALHMDNLGSHREYALAQRRRLVEAGRSGEIGEPVPVPGLPDVQSQIAIPLMVKDTLIGVFSVESSEKKTFTEHDEELVTIVANQTASAIHTARLNRALLESNQELERRVQERTAELERELRVAQELLKEAKNRVEGSLLGESRVVRELREAIAKHAASDETLLLLGPPGSGKEEVARAIHAQSGRAGAFIHVHCPQLQSGETSSLFGHGGLTGGSFDLAHAGTLYLDGVNELHPELQEDLYEILSGHARSRAAGRRPDPDVRTIVASSRDLIAEMQASRFDLELYRWISRNQLRVPALCERPEDIPVLVDHFVRRQSRQLGKAVEAVSEASMRRLQAYGWPGNVRELRHVLERVIIVSTGPVLEIDEEVLAGGISLGSYRLVKKLAAGGMGEVWLAEHDLLARPAAVKLIRADMLGDRSDRKLQERFQREARVTANLRSPHTVELYDFGVNDTGTFYYVMQLLTGIDLHELVQRFGPLPPERAVMLLAQACCSLTEAHEQGLVHRDIKPANLFLTVLGPQYDFLKVLDFGMVKAPRDDEHTRLTADNVVQGTPAYMAPEMVLGEREPDGRADLYSLGCVAYWMLTGRLVFQAKTPTSMLVQHVQQTPRPPSEVAETDIPAALDGIVLRCLAKSPDARPASAASLAEELATVAFPDPWTQKRARAWWTTHKP